MRCARPSDGTLLFAFVVIASAGYCQAFQPSSSLHLSLAQPASAGAISTCIGHCIGAATLVQVHNRPQQRPSALRMSGDSEKRGDSPLLPLKLAIADWTEKVHRHLPSRISAFPFLFYPLHFASSRCTCSSS